ncbi:hypothetical protein [Aestuariivivens sediminis]|uniref:hypothetical protein n=1 Tax=Aestuariivivens sediminis TaxID=2913557 RepID=UPI001F561F47|nr:hypothetical protein [Aestuariivivens sediminis]
MAHHDCHEVDGARYQHAITIILTLTYEPNTLPHIIALLNDRANVTIHGVLQEADRITLNIWTDTQSLFCALHHLETLPGVEHISFGRVL